MLVAFIDFCIAYASYLGLSESQGSSLVSVASAMNFVGRLAAGLLGDRIGQLNSNIIFTVISALSNFLIWTFAYSYSSLMGFMVVYGFFCGSYFALMSNISANLLGMAKLSSGLSFLLLINIVSVFGSNISSVIEAGVSSEPYFSYKMFAGVAYLLGSLILIVLKLRLDRNPFAKV
jgi:MFS family permease